MANTRSNTIFQKPVLLKEYWKTDILSGFLVFLLALPLSLGIAKASGFPPAMGVLTAIVGGIFTFFFNVSELSIKGPAAGLITVCASAIVEFGNNENAWKITCAAIVIMAVMQIVFGLLKFGRLSDFFPRTAVRGMLAAIGLIIIAKQFPVLLGINPMEYSGKTIFELYHNIPNYLLNLEFISTIIGVATLCLMFLMPLIKFKYIKKIHAPVIALIVSIIYSSALDLKNINSDFLLVKIDNIFNNLDLNIDLSAISTFTFWKYVFIFLIISSLESILTVKAIDALDEKKRTSNYNGDLIGQGFGNFISGLLGGLPMISEVVRSTSNISFGAKSKWSNFFHGLFLLLSMLLFTPLIELIPNATLAAMLIYAGYRLAAPEEFIKTFYIGKEQIIVYLTTITLTLAEDLLIGIFGGILMKFIFHLINGAEIKDFFKAKITITENNDIAKKLTLEGIAVFSNIIAYKKILSQIKFEKSMELDFGKVKIVDHSFLNFIEQFKIESKRNNKEIIISGLENLTPTSNHPLATRVLKK